MVFLPKPETEPSIIYIEIRTIIDSLSHGGIDDMVCRWTRSMLMKRMIIAWLSETNKLHKQKHFSRRGPFLAFMGGGAECSTTSTQRKRSESNSLCR